MEDIEERTPGRWARYLKFAGLGVAVVVVGVGVVYVTRSPQAGAKVAKLATNGGRGLGRAATGGVAQVTRSPQAVKVAEVATCSTPVADQVVRGHGKMQAVGPNWSEHRPIWVGPYTRSVSTAA